MSAGSKIQWTEATWNPIAGCTPVSPGCLNCYAAHMSRRLDAMGQKKYHGLTVRKNGRQVFTGKISYDDNALEAPLSRRTPTTYFVNSMSDLFHEKVPFEYVDKVFAIMEKSQQHRFQILTKRPDRMAKYLDDRESWIAQAVMAWECAPGVDFDARDAELCAWPLRNVWLGTSVEDQERADERIHHLLQCPAEKRFLSIEPLLEDVDFLASVQKIITAAVMNQQICPPPRPPSPETVIRTVKTMLHWVIVGGESGPLSRPCHVDWIRSIQQQCAAADIPCFVKQLGAIPIVKSFSRLEGWAEHVRALDRPGGLQVVLKDQKGGDMGEWANDLRQRQMPEVSK